MTPAPEPRLDAVLRVDGLRKRYGDTEVVRGLSFEIRRGEEIIRGRAHGVTAAGALEIVTADGLLRVVELGAMFQLPH